MVMGPLPSKPSSSSILSDLGAKRPEISFGTFNRVILGRIFLLSLLAVSVLSVVQAEQGAISQLPDGVEYREEMMRAVFAEDGHCVVRETEVPGLEDGEVLVEIVAVGVNRADTLQRKGLYVLEGVTPILGLEFAGIVREVRGTGAAVGDCVMGIVSGGGYAEYVAVPISQLIPVPDGMPLATAAAIPEVFLTAFQLLAFIAGVKEGDSVLIHAAGSGVGTSAVQLARLLGAAPIAVAGSDEKLSVARELGASATINYRATPQWSERVMEATGGRGASVILDCIGGQNWEQNMDAISSEGRWVLYGLLGGPKVDGPFLAGVLRKRIRLEGTTLRTRSLEYKAELARSFREVVMPAIERGDVRPWIDRAFHGLETADEAHAYMESNANIGKILIVVREE